MSEPSTEQRFESAMVDLLRANGQIEDGEFITHYVLTYATIRTDGLVDNGISVSGPSEEEGIPPWQIRGLLMEGIRILDRPDDD